MRHLVFVHQDGTSTAVAVNDLSEIGVKTWTPAQFGDGATLPQLVEDQAVAMQGVVDIHLADDAPQGTAVLATEPVLEPLTDGEFAAMEAAAVEGVAPNPWDDPE